MNKQIKELSKRICLILLISVLLFTMMPLSPLSDHSAVYGATVGTFRYGSPIKDAKGKVYNWKKSQMAPAYWWDAQGNKVTDKAATYESSTAGIEKYMIKTGSKTIAGYCIAHGIRVDTTTNLSGKQSLESWAHTGGYPKSSQHGIEYSLIYGYQPGRHVDDLAKTGFAKSNYWHKTASAYTDDDWYIATQVLIWEYQQLIRTDSLDGGHGRQNNGLVKADHYYSIISGRAASDIYNYMASCIKKHPKIASFAKKDEATAKNGKGWLMKKDAATGYWTCTLKDSNHIGLELKSTGTSAKNWQVEKIGDQYTFIYKGKNLSEDGIVFKFGKVIPIQESYNGGKMLIWSWSSSGSLRQAIATGVPDHLIPMYIKFRTGGDEEKPKEGEPKPDYWPVFEFPVHKDDKNPGWDGDTCTPMGDATLASTFVLYRNGEEVDCVTLDEYGNTEILTDQPWTSIQDLTKTASGTYTHTETDDEGRISNHCTITPTQLEWKNTEGVEYEVVEIPAAGRFTEAESGSGTDKRRYEVSYYAVTNDDRTCVTQEPKWSDIQYMVNYKTTMGTNTGDHTEEGTLEDLNDQLSLNEEIWINDNFRGKLLIKKQKESEDVFNEEGSSGSLSLSTKSKWKMYLNSGGYEGHPYLSFKEDGSTEDGARKYKVVRDAFGTDNAVTALSVSDTGSLFITDIPYGIYTVEEVSADDESFVLEKFEVDITEDGRQYTKSITNKKKENVIKVVKTDAETGKPVRLKGTKFYIRYMGNHLLDDPAQSPNYGRLLPNASDINSSSKDFTFSCDANGEIILPYDLEFGTYRLEEFLLPDGYFVGKYDKDGNGTNADYGESGEYEKDDDGKAKDDMSWETIRDENPANDLVAIYDQEGNKAEYKAGDIFNFYTFKVEKQDGHMDGDEYSKYYKAVAMKNNPVKGKIEIKKEGEILAGFEKTKKNGYTVWTPKYIWGKLKDAVFGIYAAIDEWLSDGCEGSQIYDSISGEQIKIPTDKKTHSGTNGKGEIYEEGTFDHESGAKLYYRLDREASLDNHYTRIYTTPEQRPTSCGYSFEKTENGLKYRYDINVKMQYNAGGNNYTNIEVDKVTSVLNGYAVTIPTTEAAAIVGGNSYNPAINIGDTDGNVFDIFKSKDVYEIKGEKIYDEEGKLVTDLGDIGTSRYVAEDDVPETQYEVPKGWTEVPYIPEMEENEGVSVVRNPHYVMILKTENSMTHYRILLRDGTWQECDQNGNFQKMVVEEYKASYTQQAENESGFTFELDGIIISSEALKDGTATTVIHHPSDVQPSVQLGIGYSQKTEGNTTTFIAREAQAPLYFMTEDGIKTEMYYFGNTTKTLLTIPMKAVEGNYEKVMPSIRFTRTGEVIDWFSQLNPDSPTYRREAAYNNTVTATRHEGDKDNDVCYTVEIISDQTADGGDGPFEITYADGYTAKIYKGESEAGNEIGIMVIDGIYKTSSAALSDLVEVITTGEDGTAVSSELPLGKYILRELSAPDGYVVDTEKAWKVNLQYKDQYTPLVWSGIKAQNDYVKVELDLCKVFETGYRTDDYTAGGGATFGIYNADPITYNNTALPADSLLDVLTVDSNGKALSQTKIPSGLYYLKELKTRSGYILNDTPYYFAAGDSVKSIPLVISQDEEGKDDDGLIAKAVMDGFDRAVITVETLTRYPAASMTINGKQYALDQETTDEYLSIKIQPDMSRTKIIVTEDHPAEITLANGKKLDLNVKGNTYRYTYDGVEGTYVPTVAATGYHASYALPDKQDDPANPQNKKLILTAAGGTSAITLESMYEKQQNQDLTFFHSAKVSLTTGTLIHAVLNRKNLDADTLAEPITVEKGDRLILKTDDKAAYVIEMKSDDSIKISVSDAIEGVMTDDKAPKLTLDGQTVTEGFYLAKSVTTARQDSSSKTVQVKINTMDDINADAVKNEAGEVPDVPEVPNIPAPGAPSIKTTATDYRTKDHIAHADHNVVIIDTVSYRNLEPGKTYRIKGWLIDQSSGETVKKDGKEITAEKVLRPENTNGTIDLAFSFDGSDLAGKAIVVFERLYLDDRELAKHTDINDRGQTISFPVIKTTAADSETKEHITRAMNDRTIIDVIEYQNLIPGKTYSMTGALVDRNTGKEITVKGEKIRKQKTFVAEQSKGAVKLAFNFDASHLAGTTVVAYETLTYDGVEIASHKDVSDRGQTIYIPEIKTSASHPSAGVITDVIKYSNLLPGKKYTVTGILMDRATGKPVLSDGKTVTSEKEFTPETSGGNIELDFSFKEEMLSGKTVVVFETLKLKDTVVGVHQDFYDKAQTVEIRESAAKLIKKEPESPKTGDENDLQFFGLLLIVILLMTLFLAKRKKL